MSELPILAALGVILLASAAFFFVGRGVCRTAEQRRLTVSKSSAEETSTRILADAEREAEQLRKTAVLAARRKLISSARNGSARRAAARGSEKEERRSRSGRHAGPSRAFEQREGDWPAGRASWGDGETRRLARGGDRQDGGGVASAREPRRDLRAGGQAELIRRRSRRRRGARQPPREFARRPAERGARGEEIVPSPSANRGGAHAERVTSRRSRCQRRDEGPHHGRGGATPSVRAGPESTSYPRKSRTPSSVVLRSGSPEVARQASRALAMAEYTRGASRRYTRPRRWPVRSWRRREAAYGRASTAFTRDHQARGRMKWRTRYGPTSCSITRSGGWRDHGCRTGPRRAEAKRGELINTTGRAQYSRGHERTDSAWGATRYGEHPLWYNAIAAHTTRNHQSEIR